MKPKTARPRPKISATQRRGQLPIDRIHAMERCPRLATAPIAAAATIGGTAKQEQKQEQNPSDGDPVKPIASAAFVAPPIG
jgi:hypothetical protein